MNRDIMEELKETYEAAFEKAGEIIDFAMEKCAFEGDHKDTREIATILFVEYCRRIRPQQKGAGYQHEKGNNAENPASKSQVKLIKTLVMVGGAPAEREMKRFREAYGLYEEPDMAELFQLRMGQASDVITRLKELKPR